MALNEASGGAPQMLEKEEIALVDTLSKTDKAIYIAILGMLAAFGPICTDIYLPALPAITRDLLTDPTNIQLSLTASFLGLAIGQLFIGPMSDAWGRKGPLLASLILFAAASAACAMAQSVWFLIVMRFFQGCAGSGGVVLSRSMACDMFSGEHLTKFMALLMSINSLAPILGPIFGSFIITIGSWHLLFWFLTAWGALLTFGSLFKVRETLPAQKRDAHLKSAVLDMFRQLLNWRFLCLSLSMSFIMGGFFSYLAASPFVFQVIYGYSALAYSVIFAVNAFIVALLAHFAGRLSHRLGDARIVRLSCLVMFVSAVFMLGVAVIEPKSSIFALAGIMGFISVLGASQTAGFGIVMSARTGGAGAASGIFGVLGFFFGALMSPLVGLMGETSMLPLALCLLGAAVFSYLLFELGLKLKKPEK